MNASTGIHMDTELADQTKNVKTNEIFLTSKNTTFGENNVACADRENGSDEVASLCSTVGSVNNGTGQEGQEDNMENKIKNEEEKEKEEQRRRNNMLLNEIFSYYSSSYCSSLQSKAASESQQSYLSTESHIHNYKSSRQRGVYFTAPVRIKSSAVDEFLSRVPQAATHKDVDVAKKSFLPNSLPQELYVPLSFRCSFCQKFDSLCSKCHRKWNHVLRQRQHTIAFQHYCKLPANQRTAILFMSAAHGVGDFAAMQFAFDGERCLRWRSPFFPCDGSAGRRHCDFVAAGEVYALHVAFAYDNVGVAKVLLGHHRSLFLKSENLMDPLFFLNMPLKAEMETMLNESSVYAEHLLAERAKQLRKAERRSEAEDLYAELLRRKPHSEHAHCGLAKMRCEQGEVEKCICCCDAIILGATPVDWNELNVEAVKELRKLLLQQYHEKCHKMACDGVLKPCGCVILDKVRVPIRRLPFSIVVDNILSFCDGVVLWNVFNATQTPLLRTAAEKLAVLLPTRLLQPILQIAPGFRELSEKLLCKMPADVKPLAILPLRPLGISAVAMADFNMFLVRVHFAGVMMKSTKTTESSSLSFWRFGRKHTKEGAEGVGERKADVAFSKQYRISRDSVKSLWSAKEISEWEVDESSVEKLEAHFVSSSNLSAA